MSGASPANLGRPGGPAQRPRDEVRLARAALSRLVEPGDHTAAVLVGAVGPCRALAVMTGQDCLTGDEHQRAAAEAGSDETWTRRFAAGRRRWQTRAAQLDPAADLIAMHRMGGGLLIPEDDAWPRQLDDLGIERPFGLWYRGEVPPPEVGDTLAAVGSREATSYGRLVTERLIGQAAQAGLSIVSGGAYGIDGIAHRTALERGVGRPTTLAVLAGGLDRFYPSGHRQMLGQIAATGLLLSEMPPGASPTRHRFLHRNRLIAALAGAVVVLEARWRSGAQNTAHHALRIGREVGVVPGPITSPSSAGCHRLLLETPARLVMDTESVLDLVPGGRPVQGEPGLALMVPDGRRARDRAAVDVLDELDELESRVYEALAPRTHRCVDELSTAAGLPVPQLLTGLQRLARRGLAEQSDQRWRAVRPS
ncbi:DNA processing protein [Micrococcus cohnii]|uniref:DNA processing protein n=2 Tax=Micrococcus TaxID=1269 RepID=A0A7W7M2P1_9MICC|nr:DNA-processing protein DprA [Micrococcus cohnii]MBB4735047.1 DNA processing protein [Micrococcus cohnii]